MTKTMTDILITLISEINEANSPEALEGYFDGLGESLNDSLLAHGLPILTNAYDD